MCSLARLEANRRNAQKSTGPRTPEGKATSARNALRHGLAGAGDLLGPADDPDLVAERAAALADEWGAVGTTGHLLARRAAVLATRLERLADRAEAQASAAYRRAVAEFDDRRRQLIACLIAELGHGAKRAAKAHQVLKSHPDGLLRLIDHADELIAGLQAGGEEAEGAQVRALAWLAVATPATAGDAAALDPPTSPGLVTQVTQAIEGLLAGAGTAEPSWRALRLERHRIGLSATFDPSPEATQARRYEAAAERGFFQTLRLLRTREPQTETTPPQANPTPPSPDAVPSHPAPAAEIPVTQDVPDSQLASQSAPSAALGSFRSAALTPHPDTEGPALTRLRDPEVDPIAHRRSRPDPRQLIAARH